MLDPVEKALLKAIAACAGAPDVDKLIAWPPLAPSLPFAVALHGTYPGPVEDAYGRDGSLPELEASISIKSSQPVPGQDRATIELEQNAIARLPEGVTVQFTRTTMPRDAGTRLKGDPILTMTPADQRDAGS